MEREPKQPQIKSPERQRLEQYVDIVLTHPSRIEENNPEKDLARGLGKFLIEKGFITGIDKWEESWGCKYHSGTKVISVNEKPMPKEAYDYYIFRLGTDSETGEQLFPNPDEADQYRFFHETSHAYQNYRRQVESPDNPDVWYDKALDLSDHGLKTAFSYLFQYCYSSRDLNRKNTNSIRGLSTWGNYPRTDLSEKTQLAVGALEDANELITMYLWNPKFLTTFLEYLSCEIPGIDERSLEKDKLKKITAAEKNFLTQVIEIYIKEMKAEIKWQDLNNSSE